MSNYRVELGITVTAEKETDDIDAFTDLMADKLIELDGTADMIGSAETGDFLIAVTVVADSPVAAAQLCSTLVRTAGHAAGGASPGWPYGDDDEASRWLQERSVEAHIVDDAVSLVPC
jgi:hypothetical protein